tara:strand:- start:37 stop:426 length:390 start_codon:yes stop_codon:yes gene_type:complete
MKLSKQQVIAKLQTEKRGPTEEEAAILSSTEFVLEPGNFQIKDHNDKVKSQMNDPKKTYPTHWFDGRVAVKIDDTTPKDPEGNYLVSLRGSVFKRSENMPEFVKATGTLTDVNLIPNGNSKKDSAKQPF